MQQNVTKAAAHIDDVSELSSTVYLLAEGTATPRLT